MIVSTEEGVVYTLRFGEVVFASGEELTAGSPTTPRRKQEKGQTKDKDKTKKPEGHPRAAS